MNVNETCRVAATDANGDAYNCARHVWEDVACAAFDLTYGRRLATYSVTHAATRATSERDRHAP